VGDGPNKHHLCQLGSCTLDNLLTRKSSYVVLKHAKSIGIHSKHTLFYLRSFTFKELLSLAIRELPRRQGDKRQRTLSSKEKRKWRSSSLVSDIRNGDLTVENWATSKTILKRKIEIYKDGSYPFSKSFDWLLVIIRSLTRNYWRLMCLAIVQIA
jgi:hypothetical protein